MTRNTDHCMETKPPKAVGSPVVAQVLLYRSMVCPYAEGKSKGFRRDVQAKSVITTQVKV